MCSDVELAKTLSMQNKPRPSSPFPHSLSTESSAYSSTLPHSDSWLDQLLSRPSLSSQSMKNREDTGNYREDTGNYRKDTGNYREDTGNYRGDTGNYREDTGNYEAQ